MAVPTELEYPPIFSMVLAILSLLLLFQNQLKTSPSYLNGRIYKEIRTGGDVVDLSFVANCECDKIRELIEELFEDEKEFMYKLTKENFIDSFKKLIECKILDIKKDKKFFNQFSDWENFNLKHPELFEEIGSLLKFEEMTTSSLESLPVYFILKRIETFDGFINKLPMKKILNYLIENPQWGDVWKLFNEEVFNELSPEERKLLMKYLSKLYPNDEEDLILLLVRTENYLIYSLISLKGGKLWNENEDDWIERFVHVESIADEYLKIRRTSNLRKDISDFTRFYINSPISNKLKDAIKSLFIKKATVGVTSILSNSLLIPKPYDPNILIDERRLTENLSIRLLNFYKIRNLIQLERFPFENFIQSSIILLEFLRSFSDDSISILKFLHSVHVFDLVYTETHKSSVCQWIRKALEIGSPEILNFIYFKYKNLIKSEMAGIFKIAKKEEIIKDICNFFANSEMEIELKFLLLLPLLFGSFETVLYLDFIDLDHEMKIRVSNGNESIRVNGRVKGDFESEMFNESSLKLLKLSINFLDEAFGFYLKERKGLNQRRLNIKFRRMNGQDTGGLSRHFLMTIFRILIDEKIGLFHILNDKVIPRTLLDPNVLGFIGMLHGQALKSSLKVPWLVDFDYKNQPIKLCDLIKEFERNSEGNLVPTCDDILNYVNRGYRLFHDKFDFSEIPTLTSIDSEYLNILEVVEQEFWQAGEEAYKTNLLSAVDREIVAHVDNQLIYDQILSVLKPLKSSEIDSNEFLKCFTFNGEAKDLIKTVFEAAIKADPREMIPATLKFVSGSNELPPAGLPSLNLVVNTFVTENYFERRLPQASTCQKIINWTIFWEENENDLVERFNTAIKDTKGFELE